MRFKRKITNAKIYEDKRDLYCIPVWTLLINYYICIICMFILQEDFRTLTYSLIGDDTAPQYFDVNSESGQIRTKISLELDSTELYRVSLVYNKQVLDMDDFNCGVLCL